MTQPKPPGQMPPPPPRQHRPAEPLQTRHVFLDTQVYRALRHNPENPALRALKENIQAQRLVLHITDITLAEVRRQIRELVLSRQREADAAEKDLGRWRRQAPKSAPNRQVKFDAEALAKELFESFSWFIRYGCEAQQHEALQIGADRVFAKYFSREPPFDGEDSKEFPDAFVLAALSQWAAEHDQRLYVVTKDAAMLRAVTTDANLLPLKTIEDVLARATAGFGPDAEAIAEEALAQPAFDPSFTELLTRQLPEATFVYNGDLADGEAYGGKLLGIVQVGNWSVVSLTGQRVSVILQVTADVQVEVQYEDRDNASYDHEDDRYYNTEIGSVDVEDEAEIEVFVEIDRASGQVFDGKVMTSEIDITGRSYNDY